MITMKRETSATRGCNQYQYGNIAVLILIALLCPIGAIVLAVVLFIKQSTRFGAVASAVVIGLSMALISYGIQYSDIEVDAFRLMQECNSFRYLPISSVFINPPSGYSGLIVLNLWEWIVGQLGDLRLFQASAAFFGYGLIVWALFDSFACGKSTKNEFISVLVFIVVAMPMQAIVGNVRSTLICIIAAAALYNQSKMKKMSKASLALLVLACGIHYSALLAFAIWFFRLPISRQPWKIGIIFGAIVVMIIATAGFLAEIFGPIGFFAEAIQKAVLYKEGTGFDQATATSGLMPVIHALDMVLLVVLILRLKVGKITGVLLSFGIVATFCTVGMETSLTNVGARLIYLPLLLSSYALLGEKSKTDYSSTSLLYFLDVGLIILAGILSTYSWMYFLKTFNYADVLFSAIIFPSLFIS